MIGAALERFEEEANDIQNNASNVVIKNNVVLRICWAKHVLGNKYNSHANEIKKILHSNKAYQLLPYLRAKAGNQFIRFPDYKKKIGPL